MKTRSIAIVILAAFILSLAFTAAAQDKVNLNTATVDQLTTLPGIGAATARKIVDYRTDNGNFKAAEDLMKIKGIGQSKFEKLKNLIVVE